MPRRPVRARAKPDRSAKTVVGLAQTNNSLPKSDNGLRSANSRCAQTRNRVAEFTNGFRPTNSGFDQTNSTVARTNSGFSQPAIRGTQTNIPA
jgi:hypothetical protein